MATLILSDEQVIELVKQLPVDQQVEIFRFLLLQQWGKWESLSRYGVEKARVLAQGKNLNWDTMTEEERDAFIDEVVHGD